MKNLKTFDLNYSLGKIPFGEDAIQTYLVFQPKTDILKRLLVLVMAITFITGNLKDCLTKELILLKRLIIVLLQTWIFMVLKQEYNLMGAVGNKIVLHLIIKSSKHSHCLWDN